MRGKDRTLEENRDGRRRVFLHVILMCSSQGEPGIRGWVRGRGGASFRQKDRRRKRIE